MKRRLFAWAGLGVVALAAIAGAGWILSLPSTPAYAAAPPIAESEMAATLDALKPPKRARPLVAIIGINDATETTDYVMPYGILKRSGVADVVALATAPGPLQLFPALKVEPDATITDFDAQHPDGADYVIVPAMSRDDDPAALAWIKDQAAKGATIIGICAGAKIVGEAGLLDGRRATSHWFYVDGMQKRYPTMTYVADRRLVADTGVATTTGITASMPSMLTLIEAIAGRARADAVAADLGLTGWDVRHRSGAFAFTRSFALTAIGNTLAFWNHETRALALTPDMDEVSLALVADAWSRTYQSQALTVGDRTIVTRNGLRIIPDRSEAAVSGDSRLPAVEARPAKALDVALAGIGERYGKSTASFVAMQLEYPARD